MYVIYGEKEKPLFWASVDFYHLYSYGGTGHYKQRILRKTENDCYMYKIVDVRLESSFLERLFGLGTVHCFGGDVTDPNLIISHIKNAKEVKEFILHYSEDQRLKRKTLNTQNIGGRPELDDCDPCMFRRISGELRRFYCRVFSAAGAVQRADRRRTIPVHSPVG